MTGLVFDIKRFALHDGPGIRTTAFLKGCPLACEWCQNPEGITARRILWYHSERCIKCGACVAACPVGALSAHPGADRFIHIDRTTCNLNGACVSTCPATALEFDSEAYTVDELVENLLRDRVFYTTSGGGVTLSGGEPFAQPGFSLAVLERCHAEAVDTALETTLHVERPVLEPVLPLVDHFLTDIKLWDSTAHKRYTGVGNEQILENVRWLAERSVDMVIRTPLIPGVTATESNIGKIARFVAGLPGDVPMELINFNPLASGKYYALDKPYAFATVTAPLDAGVVDRLTNAAREEGVRIVT